jgi:Domain of unknown function (DUF5069)
MSTRIFPRSPREMMAGWIYLPRLVDKIRLHLRGQLHADYQENFLHKGFDSRWMSAAGLAPDSFVDVVRNSPTDGQVCDWVRLNVNSQRAAERAAFNLALPQSGRDPDPAVQARLQFRKEQLGMLQRDDIQTFFDCIDADEGRI